MRLAGCDDTVADDDYVDVDDVDDVCAPAYGPVYPWPHNVDADDDGNGYGDDGADDDDGDDDDYGDDDDDDGGGFQLQLRELQLGWRPLETCGSERGVASTMAAITLQHRSHNQLHQNTPEP